MYPKYFMAAKVRQLNLMTKKKPKLHPTNFVPSLLSAWMRYLVCQSEGVRVYPRGSVRREQASLFLQDGIFTEYQKHTWT